MRYVEYYSEGQRQRLRLQAISDDTKPTERQRPAAGHEPVKPQEAGTDIFETLSSQEQRVSRRLPPAETVDTSTCHPSWTVGSGERSATPVPPLLALSRKSFDDTARA